MTISFWEKRLFDKTDTIIIGAGIVGLQTAIRIKEKLPKRSVWVLDRTTPGTGASLRNAGFVCFGSVGEILDDIERMGEPSALELYSQRFTGVRYLLEEYGATALGYEQTGGYEIFGGNAESQAAEVIEKMPHVNSLLADISGSDTFSSVSASKLNMQVAEQAVFARYEGMLQTHLLYQQIHNKALSLGVKVLGGMSVSGFEQKSVGWQVRTTEGYAISCSKLVFCTNGFTANLLPEVDVEPARGQVLVTSHIPDLNWRGIFHADKGYIYFRSLGTRILIGGARNTNFDSERTDNLNTTEEITLELLKFLREVVVPGKEFEVEHSWAGIMGMATDRNPIIKEHLPGLFLGVRMGGMGLALSALVSRNLSKIIADSYN